LKDLVFFQIFVNSLGESAENQVFRVRKPSVQKTSVSFVFTRETKAL
jgi:hypothetical protein